MKPTLLFALLSMFLVQPASSAAPAQEIYVVRAGDSLEKIARKNHCSSASLATANGLKSSSIIQPGQKLKLPGAAAAKTSSPAVRKDSSDPVAGKTHTIRGNDTYSSISRKYKVSVASLIAANPGVKPTALRPGQIIRLSESAPATSQTPQPNPTTPVTPTPAPKPSPVDATPPPSPTPAAPVSPKPTDASTPKPTATPPPQPQPPPTNSPEKKIRSITIESEITYGEFATKHGTTINRLNDLNGLDLTPATVLAKGSELYVPAQP